MSASTLVLAAATVLLPPTGPLAVGRVTVEWVDRSRIEPLSPDRAYRTLMVDIWYPADAAPTSPAPYLDVVAFERALGAPGLRRQLEGAYDVVRNGVRTHAVAGAPFSHHVSRAPVLIFSPGGGLVREVYTTQLEELASHGFVVAAITHPYDGIVSVYPDGHWITYDAKRWPQIPSFEGEWNLNQLEWHARDIRFVLDELDRTNRASSDLPFAGRLDLAHTGAFGHSFGGVAAAKACQTDRRFIACLNEDGLAGMRPFDMDGGQWDASQRFMLIQTSGDPGPPPDEELARMKITREKAEALLARLTHDHDAALALPRGSYGVILDRTKATHMDFTDLPLLGATTEADTEARTRVAEAIRGLIVAFFDWALRGKRPLVAGKPSPPIETIRRFGAAR